MIMDMIQSGVSTFFIYYICLEINILYSYNDTIIFKIFKLNHTN